MRMIWQAVRAVTVEAMGIGAVVFMLFSAAGWTVESVGVRPMQEVDRAWKWVQDTTDYVTSAVKPNMTEDQRRHFAADRLEHYGHLYGEAAGSYAGYAARQLDFQINSNENEPPLPKNQLLGTL